MGSRFNHTSAHLRLGVLALALLAMLALATRPAAAASPADGHPYRHGVVPPRGSAGARGAPLPFSAANSSASTRARHRRPPAAGSGSSTGNLSFGGGVSGVGVTTGAPQVYLVFWGSQWGTSSTDGNGNTRLSGDPQGVAPVVQQFFKGIGTGSGPGWSGVMTQYCEGVAAGSQTCPSSAAHVGAPGAGGALAGVWVDTSAAAPSAASGKQIGQEALAAAQHFGNTSASSNRNVQYVVVSPTGTNPDNYRSRFYGFCAWHDYSGDSTLSGGAPSNPNVSGYVAFTNLPYLPDVGTTCGKNFVNSGTAGNLDGVTIVEGHEYAETITDQYPAGGWTDSSGNENGDKCAWISPGSAGGSYDLALGSYGTYAVQTTWGNDGNSGAGACEASHAIVTSGPSLEFSGLPAGFTAGNDQTGTVQLVDANGNPVNAPSDVTVSLGSSPNGSFGSSTVTIPAGSSSSGSFTFDDTKSGTTTLTASATGYGSGTQNENVVAGPAASVSVSPSSATVGTGGAQAFTASAADQYGNPASASATTWATSAPGTLSTATGASTIFTAGGSAGAGNVTATLGGSSSSASITVTAAPATIANGGFETGSFSGWTTGGGNPTPVVAPQPHSGSYSALLGYTKSTGEPKGDSSIQQKLTVPAAGGTLSFYVWRFTTDSVRYDWQTCQIRKTSGSTLATIFKTASNAQTWQQQSYSLANWKSQSVVLWCNVHEDGYGDQTYMYTDDYAVK